MLLPFVSVRNLQYNTVPDGYLFTRPSTQTHLGDKFASRTLQPLYDREPPSHNEQEGGKYVVQGPTHRIAKQLKGHPSGPKNLRQVHSSSHVTPSRGCQRGKPADERRRRARTSGPLPGERRCLVASARLLVLSYPCLCLRAKLARTLQRACRRCRRTTDRQRHSQCEVLRCARFFGGMEDESGGWSSRGYCDSNSREQPPPPSSPSPAEGTALREYHISLTA